MAVHELQGKKGKLIGIRIRRRAIGDVGGGCLKSVFDANYRTLMDSLEVGGEMLRNQSKLAIQLKKSMANGWRGGEVYLLRCVSMRERVGNMLCLCIWNLGGLETRMAISWDPQTRETVRASSFWNEGLNVQIYECLHRMSSEQTFLHLVSIIFRCNRTEGGHTWDRPNDDQLWFTCTSNILAQINMVERNRNRDVCGSVRWKSRMILTSGKRTN